MTRAWLGLGANLGDPAAQVEAAIEAIAGWPGCRLLARSARYRSAPIGEPGQPDYCNAACVIDTRLTPEALLAAALQTERAAGRIRDGRRWAARRLDIDLLHVDGERRDSAELTLPHPQIGARNFVLVPLAEISPELDVPGLGAVAVLAAAIGSDGLRLWDG